MDYNFYNSTESLPIDFLHISVRSLYELIDVVTGNIFGAINVLPQKFQNSLITEPREQPKDEGNRISGLDKHENCGLLYDEGRVIIKLSVVIHLSSID